MTIHPSSPTRLPQANPVGRLIAGPPVAGHLHERFQQHRPVAVALLPVLTDPLRRQRQRLARQIPHPHPGKNQKSRIRHHPVQSLLAISFRPSDPRVPLAQRPRRGSKQQTAHATPTPAHQKIPLMRPKRALVAQRMVTLHVLVPQLPRFLPAYRLHFHRAYLSHRSGNLLLRSAARPHNDGSLTLPLLTGAQLWQVHQSQRLQLLQGLRTGSQFVPSCRGDPIQMFTDGLYQLLQTQPPAHPHRLLNLLNLLPAEFPSG